MGDDGGYGESDSGNDGGANNNAEGSANYGDAGENGSGWGSGNNDSNGESGWGGYSYDSSGNWGPSSPSETASYSEAAFQAEQDSNNWAGYNSVGGLNTNESLAAEASAYSSLEGQSMAKAGLSDFDKAALDELESIQNTFVAATEESKSLFSTVVGWVNTAAKSVGTVGLVTGNPIASGAAVVVGSVNSSIGTIGGMFGLNANNPATPAHFESNESKSSYNPEGNTGAINGGQGTGVIGGASDFGGYDNTGAGAGNFGGVWDILPVNPNPPSEGDIEYILTGPGKNVPAVIENAVKNATPSNYDNFVVAIVSGIILYAIFKE